MPIPALHSPRTLTPTTRRRWLVAATAAALSLPIQAQVEVGSASRMRSLVPAEQLEQSANQQYAQLLQEAKAQGRLVPTSDAQVQEKATFLVPR